MFRQNGGNGADPIHRLFLDASADAEMGLHWMEGICVRSNSR